MSSWSGILSLFVVGTSVSSGEELPATCLGQEDGYTWLKPMDGDEYPAVHQKCDNGFMIVDINEDSNMESYFSSYTTWHYALAGPENMDYANWEEWYLPSAQFLSNNDADNEEYFQFAISPDCNTCDLDNNIENNVYSLFNDDTSGERTAYYMTGTLFGCLAKHKALKDCRWDYESYTCNYCSKYGNTEDLDLNYHVISPTDSDWNSYIELYESLNTSTRGWQDLQMGMCGVYPTSTYTDMVPSTRDDCNSFRDNVKPSIGTNGQFCVCVKPNASFGEKEEDETVYTVDDGTLENVQSEWRQNREEELKGEEDGGSVDDEYELWQTDFESGTLRIKKSGTYKVMEDILFDFNAGDLDDPNTGSSWWPTSDQVDDYPGAGTTRDEYYLGFIAGITIETDDVVIDLNGHEIAMSKALYYQQRFFSCISLKSVAFPLNQGPGFFGMSPVFANNVVIKDGTIGLSSHHGIHGHYNKDVVIENVHIKDFETHGVQMSYFENLKMKNVEIGPSSTVAYLSGEYGYARWTVAALERIRDSEDFNEDQFPVTFSGRDTALSLDDIIDNLRELMDIAFKSVMGIEEYDEDDKSYVVAKELFINEDGIPYGAVMYGLFLNLWFANVFTIHPSIHHAEGATIENLKVHGLHHKMKEYIRMDKPQVSLYRNQFNAPLDASRVLGDQIMIGSTDMIWSKTTYVGSALTDAEIALSMATDDWGEQGLLVIDSNYTSWAKGEMSWGDDTFEHPYLGCNNDRMAHVPKGVIGIRMDGVQKVEFKNLEIVDIVETSPLGSDLCGVYWDGLFQRFMGGGNTLQNAPYLYGYTGNRVHGIFSDWAEFKMGGDIKISDFECTTGMIRGLGLYTASNVTFEEESTLEISNFNAGSDLYDTDTLFLRHPYAQSKAKPIHAQWTRVDDDNNTFSTNMKGHPKTVSMTCIYGRDGIAWDGASSHPWWKKNVFEDHSFSDCDVLDDETQQKAAMWGNTGETRAEDVVSPSHIVHSSQHLVWSTAMVVIMAMMGCLICLWETKMKRDSKSKLMNGSEVDPLIRPQSRPQYS